LLLAGQSMKTKPLRQLFDAMHHHKYSFEDFLGITVSEHYQPVGWRNRVIYKPSKTLKAMHSFLNSFIFEYLSTNERVSFAYRRGTTLRDAVAPHANSRAFYQTDLEKFFDSITESMIRPTVAMATTPADDLQDYLDRVVALTTVDGKLPIGFSTSPLLSNACLRHFDDQLEHECISRSWIYSRYADDIVISAQSLDGLKGVEDAVKGSVLEKLGQGFRINQAKSRVTTVGRKVKILGLVILPSGRITIDKEIREKVESQLHFYVSDRGRLAKIYEGEIEEGLERLSGYVSYIHSADPMYLNKLRRKFGGTVIDIFLHRSAQ
jgi:RNA-directed DNA polymerase